MSEYRIDPDILTRTIRAQVAARGPGNTICPSEVARALAQDWRSLMPDIRRVAHMLAVAGEIDVTQKGCPVDATTARGPTRLGLRPPCQ